MRSTDIVLTKGSCAYQPDLYKIKTYRCSRDMLGRLLKKKKKKKMENSRVCGLLASGTIGVF